MKNSSYYIALVGVQTHDLPHTVASNMVKVSHALNTLPAKDGDLRLSASNACLPKTEISVFVTECVFFTSTLQSTYVHIA